ncbi:Hypothetical protein OINT_2000504 [Brucella intermedia LMG 3301]|uniref:Uncharacterized protein n=1 Tax=Brucella intermedia LMG 3301 TaxID=641118 RepID=C4WNM9_9HYPH|nr:Hypothetical protein OINT_2000504 [Brucella intermedia LMG 3301]
MASRRVASTFCLKRAGNHCRFKSKSGAEAITAVT